MTEEVTIECAHPLSPQSYCFFCKHLLRAGDLFRIHQIDLRHKYYKKKNKKLKADTHAGVKVHAPGECK